jgi:hypothetical protein
MTISFPFRGRGRVGVTNFKSNEFSKIGGVE